MKVRVRPASPESLTIREVTEKLQTVEVRQLGWGRASRCKWVEAPAMTGGRSLILFRFAFPSLEKAFSVTPVSLSLYLAGACSVVGDKLIVSVVSGRSDEEEPYIPFTSPVGRFLKSLIKCGYPADRLREVTSAPWLLEGLKMELEQQKIVRSDGVARWTTIATRL